MNKHTRVSISELLETLRDEVFELTSLPMSSEQLAASAREVVEIAISLQQKALFDVDGLYELYADIEDALLEAGQRRTIAQEIRILNNLVAVVNLSHDLPAQRSQVLEQTFNMVCSSVRLYLALRSRK